MTVTVTTPVAGPFLPNGATTEFGFDFKVGSASEVAVYRVQGGALVEVSTALYDVTLAADGEGGTVRYAAAPLAGSGEIYIYSEPDFSQQTQFSGEGAFNPRSLNGPIDRAAVRDIYLKRRLDEIAPGGLLPVARAGKFLAWDAEGGPVASVGTGADAGLRTDLAAPAGSSHVGFLQSGTGAVARTLQAEMRDWIKPQQFGADATGAALSDTAFNAAIAAAVAQGKGLDLAGGSFKLSAGGAVNFARSRLHIRGRGSTLTFTGAGIGFNLDQGGANGQVLEGMVVEDLLIIGGTGVTDGFYSRGVVRSLFRNIEVRNVTGKAFHIKHAVSNQYDSLRYSGNSHTPAQTPAHGLYMTNNGAGYYCANNLFNNLVMEGFAGIGAELADATGNAFVGGTLEATTTGLIIGATSNENTFVELWCEGNTVKDVDVSGNNNGFSGAKFMSSDISGPNVSITASGKGTWFNAGTYIRHVEVNASSSGTSFVQCGVDQNLTGTVGFQGSGSYTRISCLKVDANSAVVGIYPDILGEAQAIGISGVWIPVLTPGSGTITPNGGATTGRYRRIGDQVTLQAQVTVTSVATPSGALTITGVPYAAAAAKVAAQVYCEGLQATATSPVQAALSGSTITLTKLSGGVATDMAADIKAGSVITLSLSYQAA